MSRIAEHPGVLALAALLALGCLAQASFSALDWGEVFWNDVRLSRAWAALGGADLYAGESEGVLPGHLYGPVGFFLYAPVKLAATPGGAIQIGAAVSGLLVLIPFGWTLYRHRSAGPWAALLAVAVFHLFFSEAASGLWIVHVDAPAVGLVLVSFYCLLRLADAPDRLAWMAVTAAFAAAAAWTKQTMAPALVLPAALLWMAGERRTAATTLGLTVLFGLVFAAVFSALYGFEDLWFTMFAVPAQHERFWGRLLMDSAPLTGLMDLLPLAAVLILLGEKIPRMARYAFAYAAALAPFAALGRLKISGDPNNYLGPDVFLTLGLCLAVTTTVGRGKRFEGPWAVVGLLMIVQMGRVSQALAFEAVQRMDQAEVSATDEAFRFLRDNPGEAYFPWNPLAMQMATGELYHTGHGILTRQQAGLPVSEEQWRAHLPRDPRYLATPLEARDYLLERLPEFDQRVESPDLERWTVYESVD